MVLNILRNLSLNRIQMLIRILDGCILFMFITVFLTSVIINIKNRNLKSMLISLIFIIIYAASSAGTFFGIFLLNKLNIEATNTNYYIEVGILAIIQIAMIVLIYIFADPFAREKKIEQLKETGQYDEIMKKKQEKKQKKIDKKNERKKKKQDKKQENNQKKLDKKQDDNKTKKEKTKKKGLK